MRLKCIDLDCDAPKAFCKKLLSPNYQECDSWRKLSDIQTSSKKTSTEGTAIPWSGMELTPDTINILSHRSVPLIIGLIGAANAGKTSYLGILYTLLFNGRQFNHWRFAGSYTLIAWESQAKGLKIQSNGKVSFPHSTPAQPDYYSLYHLALKKESKLYDILFADSSGEVFTKWAAETDNSEAENAKWIYENSHTFIFFVDCEALINGRGRARNNLLQLAGQVSANLNKRKVIVVWSKADRITEVPPTIKLAVDNLLKDNFPDAPTFLISNFSKSADDDLCYVNNLAASETAFDSMILIEKLELYPRLPQSSDFFFNYHGSKRK
jgi:hypothetical protein